MCHSSIIWLHCGNQARICVKRAQSANASKSTPENLVFKQIFYQWKLIRVNLIFNFFNFMCLSFAFFILTKNSFSFVQMYIAHYNLQTDIIWRLHGHLDPSTYRFQVFNGALCLHSHGIWRDVSYIEKTFQLVPMYALKMMFVWCFTYWIIWRFDEEDDQRWASQTTKNRYRSRKMFAFNAVFSP